jgi:hypothetical protein
MKRTALAAVVFSLLASACSAILGDFDSGSTDAGPEGGSSGSGSGGSGGDGSTASSADAASSDGNREAGSSGSSGGGASSSGAVDASPADASPADASPADASPADASPADASSADAHDSGDAGGLSGAYALRVNATSGGAAFANNVTVQAVAPTVFCMRGDLLDGGSSMFTSAYYAAGSDGTQTHAVTCPVVEPTSP